MPRNSRKRKTKAPDKHFPEGILFDIVSRLPVKSVVRCTTVSKSWYALIKSRDFIATHVKQSIASNINDDSSHYILDLLLDEHGDKPCVVLRDNVVSFDPVYSVDLPMDFELRKCKMVGSCNGLVCLTGTSCFADGCLIYLWNPLLRRIKRISCTSSCCNRLYRKFTNVGFWYDNEKNDYKLIMIRHYINKGLPQNDKEQSQVELYSLYTASWRKIDDVKMPGILLDGAAVFVDGSLNWIAYHSLERTYSILSFDTRLEVFREMKLPNYDHYNSVIPYLVVYKGCLALFVAHCTGEEDVLSLWVMKEFGLAESWLEEYHVVFEVDCIFSVGFTKNSVIIYATYDEMFVYDFEKKQSRDIGLGFRCDADSLVEYTESLVLLDEKNELQEN
ncbi:F-box CPR1-like [Olea europaea subsp. europaea]|uniref:F-box CPR1-like n=1 Tax=Olea europaea subsp. europaea TaxID=158383 RepID=A0A8S0VLP9_OLEEU|nr:F-box CPR1-like [Olea europaea subsp. europaea]